MSSLSSKFLHFAVSILLLKMSIIVPFVINLACAQDGQTGTQHWVTVYYPQWSEGPLSAKTIPAWEIDWRGITHVIFNNNDNISSIEPWWLYVTSPSDSLKAFYGAGGSVNYLDSLTKYAHVNGVAALVSIQSISNNNISRFVTDSIRTEIFVDAVVSWAERHHFDGVDLNWENWGGSHFADKNSNTRLLRRFRARLNRMKSYYGARAVLTMAPNYFDYKVYYTPDVNATVDQVNIQCYANATANNYQTGRHGAWFIDALYKGTNPKYFDGEAISIRGPLQWATNYGYDRKIMGVGIAGYSLVYRGADQMYGPYQSGWGEPGNLGIKESEAFVNNGGTMVWDSTRMAKYIYGTAITSTSSVRWGQYGVKAGQKFWMSLPSPENAREVAQWTKDQGLGGMMLYDFTTDIDPSQPRLSGLRNKIISAVATAMSGGEGRTVGNIKPSTPEEKK